MMAMGAALSLPGCGHDQKLVSIQIAPSSYTFLVANAGQTEQLTATGTFIHPPANKPLTGIATWKVDNGLVTANAGLITTIGNGACGGAIISASYPEGTGGSNNIVTGYATVTVDDPTNPICPGGGTQATLSVQVSPIGRGTVTSLTGGINCPGVCIATFPVGASVGLTANPTGGGTVAWTKLHCFSRQQLHRHHRQRRNKRVRPVPIGTKVLSRCFAWAFRPARTIDATDLIHLPLLIPQTARLRRYYYSTTMYTRDPVGEFLRITERYRQMSDSELLVLIPQSPELTPLAQLALASEVRSRGLKVEVQDEESSALSSAQFKPAATFFERESRYSAIRPTILPRPILRTKKTASWLSSARCGACATRLRCRGSSMWREFLFSWDPRKLREWTG